jgi:hypothetical protein
MCNLPARLWAMLTWSKARFSFMSTTTCLMPASEVTAGPALTALANANSARYLDIVAGDAEELFKSVGGGHDGDGQTGTRRGEQPW